ncbi:hypothetical protein niasHS_016374 [Heterodera schachtii]|uniref:Uncharacterized protein n=1 Tax=Heterodera schachtii TaxID=97005 RepID=A0ABD2HTN7_HETSC
MDTDWERITQLPNKLNNNGNFPTITNSMKVVTNAFEINLEKARDKVYQYEHRFCAKYSNAKSGKELPRGPRNE